MIEVKASALQHDATVNIKMYISGTSIKVTIYYNTVCKLYEKYLNSRVQESYSVKQRFPHRHIANI